MIKVTRKDGKPHWIAPSQVVHLTHSGEPGMSTLTFSNGTMLTLQDKPEELQQRITDFLTLDRVVV